MHLISYTTIILMMTVFSLIRHFNHSYGTRVTRLPPKFCVEYFSIPQLLDNNFFNQKLQLGGKVYFVCCLTFPLLLFYLNCMKFVIGFCMCVLLSCLFYV